MASLSGSTIASTFKSLLKLAGNTDDLASGGSTAIQVMTGDGENTPIYLNTDRVGIGTDSPNSELDVAKAGGPVIRISGYSSSANVEPLLEFRRSKHASIGSHTIQAADDSLGAIRWFGSDGVGYEKAASISCNVETGVGTGTDMPGRLVFSTSPDGTDSPVTRMTIKADGNIGIGTTSPDYRLQVEGDANNSTRIISIKGTHTSGNSSGGVLQLVCDDGGAMANNHRLGAINFKGAEDTAGVDSQYITAARIEAFADENWDTSNNGTYLAFSTASGDNNEAEVMRIDMVGNVGIGTSAFSSGVSCLGLINGTDPGGTTTNTACLLTLSGEMNYTDASGNIATLDSLSDERAKDNITVIPDALSRIANVKGVTFNYVSYKDSSLPFKNDIADDVTFASHDKYGDSTRVGVIAQDVEKAYEGLSVTNAVLENIVESPVVGDMDDHVQEIYGNVKKVRVETLVPLLIEAVKELSAKVTALENA